MGKKASSETMEILHAALANHFKDAIEKGVMVMSKDGVLERVDASPALLNAARQFLKDNGIEGPEVDNNTKQTLADKLRAMSERGDDGPDPFANVAQLRK